MFLISLAHAELPWDCPTDATPEGLAAYRENDAGSAALDLVEAAALELWDDACAWVITEDTDENAPSIEYYCNEDGVELRYAEMRQYSDTESGYREELEVTVESGASWTHIMYAVTSGEWTSDGAHYSSGTTTREAEWTGAIDGLPDDQSLSVLTSNFYDDAMGMTGSSSTVTTDTCRFRWWENDVTEYIFESVAFSPGHDVDVTIWPHGSGCGRLIWAELDGVMWGAIDETTWADDPTDLDHDGLPPVCDCDETDPTRNDLATDTPYNGIDEDCDGVDRADADADGFWNSGGRNADCDDADAAIHPGAEEVPCDGVDNDCSDGDADCEDTAAPPARALDLGDPPPVVRTPADTGTPRDEPIDNTPVVLSGCSSSGLPPLFGLGLLLPILRRSRRSASS